MRDFFTQLQNTRSLQEVNLKQWKDSPDLLIIWWKRSNKQTKKLQELYNEFPNIANEAKQKTVFCVCGLIHLSMHLFLSLSHWPFVSKIKCRQQYTLLPINSSGTSLIRVQCCAGSVLFTREVQLICMYFLQRKVADSRKIRTTHIWLFLDIYTPWYWWKAFQSWRTEEPLWQWFSACGL